MSVQFDGYTFGGTGSFIFSLLCILAKSQFKIMVTGQLPFTLEETVIRESTTWQISACR